MMFTKDHIDFMNAIRFERPLPLADRKQDRIRQSLRRAGYVEYKGSPKRWYLTSSGWAYMGHFYPWPSSDV